MEQCTVNDGRNRYWYYDSCLTTLMLLNLNSIQCYVRVLTTHIGLISLYVTRLLCIMIKYISFNRKYVFMHLWRTIPFIVFFFPSSHNHFCLSILVLHCAWTWMMNVLVILLLLLLLSSCFHVLKHWERYRRMRVWKFVPSYSRRFTY